MKVRDLRRMLEEADADSEIIIEAEKNIHLDTIDDSVLSTEPAYMFRLRAGVKTIPLN